MREDERFMSLSENEIYILRKNGLVVDEPFPDTVVVFENGRGMTVQPHVCTRYENLNGEEPVEYTFTVFEPERDVLDAMIRETDAQIRF